MKKQKKDILFLIMARLNSERVERKMIKRFAGTNLLDISLKKLKNCKSIPTENIYLAAHEKELLAVAKNNDINTFKRSYESSVEEREISVLYDWCLSLKNEFKYYVMINPCCPFLKEDTIDNFVDAYITSEHDGMFGVVKKRNMMWDDEFRPLRKHKKNSAINTKSLDVFYEAAHCLYAGNIDRLSDGIHMGTFDEPNDPYLYVMDNGIELLDIDYQWQFKMCESLYTMLHA